MKTPDFAQGLLAQINTDERIIIDFFAVFSRFEYSLKRAGYLQENKFGVSADWDKFATDLSSCFEKYQSQQLKQAVEYFIKYPPQKQVSLDGCLSWKDMPWDQREPIIKWLLIAVRRVRNNLFHGGKFPMQPIKDPSRDQQLIEYSICILEECLSLETSAAKKVRKYFKEYL
ncbi:hypothetical protein WKK05_41250 (plasmid) [Nostoc sp. UHCC 0302]|uniref:hypothetical protein n=1 Tax=Nostoc sp. UHCC 0302 TaxID=3134896 RepID=UPI00311CAEB1